MVATKKAPAWVHNYCIASAVVVTGWLLYALPRLAVLTGNYLASVGRVLFPNI